MDTRKRRKLSLEDKVAERNWSDLVFDLLILVVRKIESSEDYFALRAVCTSWRHAAAYEDFNWIRRLPCQVQTKNDRLEFSNPLATACASSVVSRAAATILSQEIHNCVSCRGWILVVQKNREMNLVHFVSGVHIKLPDHEKSYSLGINKMVLSFSPLTNPVDYTLVIVYDVGAMAYWRPGDKTFTELQSREVSDVIFCNGSFYGVTASLCHVLLIKESPDHPTVLAERSRHNVFGACLRFFDYLNYLVESDGDLLLVVRLEGKFDSYSPERRGAATHFGVYKIEKVEGVFPRMTEIKNMGNRAIFIGGFNASFSVNANEIPGCKPNHIYFTGNPDKHAYRYREKHHMGIYSMTDGLVESSVCGRLSGELCCTCLCPPLWVTPTLV